MAPNPGLNHLFLSYHSQDRGEAITFAERLKGIGFRVWFDKWSLLPGDDFSKVIEEVLSTVPVVVVLVGSAGIGPWEQFEINAALIQSTQRGLRIIPVLLRGAPTRPELPLFLQSFTWLDLQGEEDDTAFDRLKSAILETQPHHMQVGAKTSELTLPEILHRAQKHLIISGHTLDKFTRNPEVRISLIRLLARGVRLSIIQLNPLSQYARAHQPYHELESTSSAETQYDKTLRFLESIFEGLDRHQQNNLEVVFSNYMPRFRTIIVDDTVILYLYMYAVDVPEEPDFILAPSNNLAQEKLRDRVRHSTLSLLMASEVVPFIKCGQVFKHWTKSKLANWDSWSQLERKRHKIIYEFYVTFAQKFHNRFGYLLEREVKAHLDQIAGKIIVLGCGSGKEVDYLAKRQPQNDVYGIDFSQVAVNLAKTEHPQIAGRFLLGDFYDLEHLLPGQVDSIVANAAFVHLYNRDDIDEMLRKAWEKLAPGGTLFLRALYKENNGISITEEEDTSDGHQEEWKASRWFIYFSREELIRRAEIAGFEVLNEMTEKIAKSEFGVSGRRLKDILEKGFPHSQYPGVFWPTLILQKNKYGIPGSK